VTDRTKSWLPAGTDLPALAVLLAALALTYGPAYGELSQTVWKSDEQGHGPIIFAVALWLLWKQAPDFFALDSRPSRSGWLVLVFSVLLFAVGRAMDVWIFSIGSQIGVLAAVALLLRGWPGLRCVWFPLFFLLFMVPLPEALVAMVTAPLKSAVSAVASWLLYTFGYPVGRSGVILTVGQYQLLVADACAGLNSMFTLEALGMLYMKLMNYTSVVRNVTLALLLIPVAFVANIGRVMILVLVTYYFGDAAGQGFVHDFAGMVLFMIALLLMFVVDRFLNLFFARGRE
jgi:exosortase B